MSIDGHEKQLLEVANTQNNENSMKHHITMIHPETLITSITPQKMTELKKEIISYERSDMLESIIKWSTEESFML